MKAEELFHYKDYIKSEYWQERKRKYFETHERKCMVCGHPDVDLHHIKYGSYGHEHDRDLAPLCRVHHQGLHDAIGVRKNTRFQSRDYIEQEREKRESRFNVLPPTFEVVAIGGVSTIPVAPVGPSALEKFIEKIAAPIWKLLGR